MKIFIQMSIALLFFLAGSISMQAQDLSKEEAKKWKKVAKEYKKNPAALKILTEERDRYRQEAESAEQRIQAAQSELLQEKERNSDLQEQVTQLRNELMITRQTNEGLMEQIQDMEQRQPEPTPTSQEDFGTGTVFRIQVGAFKNVPSRFNQYSDLFVEEAGGLKKVLLGAYRDYEQAKVRLSQLKREGYPGAWVVGYINGRRVSLKEALNN
jgi:chromosome segregation ATPase